ncbi:MAG: DUF1674 domain-containing protein, partial [Erythrobacter sp.]
GKSRDLRHGPALDPLETERQRAHLERAMTKQKSQAAKAFRKPAHWINDPVPEPKAVDPLKDEPRELSPTRYGDWEKNGIAWDF